MVRQCVVKGCKSNIHASLHVFPSLSADPDRHSAWVAFVQRTRPGWLPWAGPALRPGSRSLICSGHFTIDCFANVYQVQLGFAKALVLSSMAVPTVYPAESETSTTVPLFPLDDPDAMESEVCNWHCHQLHWTTSWCNELVISISSIQIVV